MISSTHNYTYVYKYTNIGMVFMSCVQINNLNILVEEDD